MQAMNPDDPDNQTAMYCNKYPSTKGKQFPEGALRIYAHTDFELLTLLFTRPGILLCKAQVSCCCMMWLHKMTLSMIGCST
jgi:hypothetical protein